ncbi:MAG: AAA family ATPase [Gammaproteobacteria bacterium]|nr:AAA family ATPase [Gammaproteobacteria bacterium]
MYEGFFGLAERPFSIAPDPQYLYMSERHKEAMAHLSYGLSQGGCFIVLTGEVGTGKTTLCRNLLGDLPENVDVALILNANINETELLQTVCDELKIDYAADASLKQLLDAINQHLLSAYSENRHTVLIIDEAQLLGRDVLEQIRLLTNLETTKHKLLQIILIGQPELNAILSRNDLRQLAQRVTARYHLGALDRNEIADYVNFRLGVAGCKQPVFSRQALSRLHNLSEGIPRKINVLADHSLLNAYSKSQSTVDSSAVKAAAREVFISTKDAPKESKSGLSDARQWLLPAAFLVLLNIGLWWWFIGGGTANKSAPTPVTSEVSEQQAGTTEANQPAADNSTGAPISQTTPVDSATPDPALATPLLSEIDPASPAESAPQDESGAAQQPASDEATDQVAGPGAPEPALAEDGAVIADESIAAEPTAEADASPDTITTTITNVAAQPGTMVVSDEFLSAAPDDVVVPESSELGALLDTSADLTGRITTLRALAQMWGVQLPQQLMQAICSEVQATGLRCLGVETWQQLLRYNRPTAMVLTHNDQLHRVILTALQKNTAEVLVGERSVRVSVAELQQRWNGNALAFWRPSPLGTRVLQLNDRVDSLVPLRIALNQALQKTGLPLLEETAAKEFDMDMAQKVFALQNRFAIVADSKVGNETYLLLNEILQPEQTRVLVQRVAQ